ncbi:transmembrane protein, putative [Medicago truncatula]|uniref:Transmembrane protein, putative n=1 Tax=Medicago truncatula TaxID=3880 RepID=A0A072V542_MEDTR|nr:transmembrane protein, putative [Medicago truncatula]
MAAAGRRRQLVGGLRLALTGGGLLVAVSPIHSEQQSLALSFPTITVLVHNSPPSIYISSISGNDVVPYLFRFRRRSLSVSPMLDLLLFCFIPSSNLTVLPSPAPLHHHHTQN